jgi:hypothetical protein
MRETKRFITIDATMMNKRSSREQPKSYHAVKQTEGKMMKESRVSRIRQAFSCLSFGKARKDDGCKLSATRTPSPLARTKGSDKGLDDSNPEECMIIFSDSSDTHMGPILPKNLMNHFPAVNDLEPVLQGKNNMDELEKKCYDTARPRKRIDLNQMRQSLKKMWRAQKKNGPLSSTAECEASNSDFGDADFDTRSAHFSVTTDLTNETKSPTRKHWGSALLPGCHWAVDEGDTESVEVGWSTSPTSGVGCTTLKEYLEKYERKAQDIVEFGEINAQDSKSVCSAVLDVSFEHKDECAQLVLKTSSSVVSTSSLSFSNEQDEVLVKNEGSLGASFPHPAGKSSLYMESFRKAASPAFATPPARRTVPLNGRKWVEGKLGEYMESRIDNKMKNAKRKDTQCPGAIAVASSVDNNNNNIDDDDYATNDEGPSDFDNNTSDLGWSFSHDDDSIMTFTSQAGDEIFKPSCRYASNALLLNLPVFVSPKMVPAPPCRMLEDSTPLTVATSSSSSTRTPEDKEHGASPRRLVSPPTRPPVPESVCL